MLEIMKPGTKIVSLAGVPEPQTAIKDLGGRRTLAVVFWIISYGTIRELDARGSAIGIFSCMRYRTR